MIGQLPAPPALVDGETFVQQIGRPRARSGRIERRMLQKPDKLGRGAVGYRGGALFHDGESVVIGDRRITDEPLDRRRAGSGWKPDNQAVSCVNHSFTIPW